jgi:multidrug efflux pump
MIPRFFIDRPIAAFVISFVTVLIGALALTTLPIAQYPDVVPPQIVVTAVYPGANGQTVAETVATPIELEINGVENMLYMESQCTNDGAMRLTVTFAHGTDPDKAQVWVQNRVAVATAKLPEEVRRIGVVTKKQSSAILLVVSLYGEEDKASGTPARDQLFVSNFATLNVKDELARIYGVGDVFMFGQREYSVRVWLDPAKMADQNLTTAEVVKAIRSQNQQVAAGQIGQNPAPKGQAFQMTINTQGRLPSAAAFEDIVVGVGSNEQLVRLNQVGRVELGARNYDSSATLDGRPSVGLPIFQLPGGNALETAEAVQEKMKALRADPSWPTGMEYAIVFNPTTFVEDSVYEVVKTLFEAFVLVFVVVLVFLQSWRAALIPMIAVPVSLIGTFAAMSALGYSVNNLTLFGMVLAIGIVVDDAIVVVEAVEAEIAKGLSPIAATRKAMDEVSGAIIGVSLVLAAVFIPSAFLSGLTGQFFRQFAVTIAVSTLLSAVNSLTLSPALCPLLLRPHGAKKDPIDWVLSKVVGSWFNWVFDRGSAAYAWGVGKMARLAIVVLLVYGGFLVLTGLGFRLIPGGFIPQQDQGYLVINVTLPDGASVERSQAVVNRVTDLCLGPVGPDGKRDKSQAIAGIDHITGIAGYSIFASANLSNSGGIYVSLAPFAERVKSGRTADAILNDLRGRFAGIQEARVDPFGAPPILGLGSAGGFKLQVQDKGKLGAGVLEGMTQNLALAAMKERGIPAAFTGFSSAAPQLYVEVDRDRVQQMGLSVQDVNDTLQAYLGSVYVNDVTLEQRTWQVNVQAEPEARAREDDIGKLKIRGPKGDMIPLEGLIRVSRLNGPAKVNRYLMYQSADLNGFTIPFLLSSGDAIRKMDALAKRELPPGLGYEWTDMAYQQVKAANQEVKLFGVTLFKGDTTLLIFGLSALMAYLVLAFLYESLLLPLAVILVVPMCLLCAAAGIVATRGDLNIFSQIGLVVLVGLACKNAILIVEFAKQRREAGATRIDAAKDAARSRLRPILMTSFAFILGVVPLVIAKGAGAEMRRAIGVTVFSGMLGVTLFGLVLTPVFYVVMDWFRGEPKKPVADAPAHG